MESLETRPRVRLSVTYMKRMELVMAAMVRCVLACGMRVSAVM